MPTRLWLLALGLSTGAWVNVIAADAPALPQTITPQDARLHYSGRWDVSTPATPRCEWTACAVALSGNLTSVNVQLSGRPDNAFEVIVDGVSAGVITMVADQKLYSVVAGLPAGRHTIALVKRTESWNGPVQVLGFQAAKGTKLTDPEIPKHRIEFLGDSITCGYGNEAKAKEEHFSNATENAWLAWGSVAARSLQAEVSVEAVSGIWLQDPPDQKKSLPAIWDLTLPFSSPAIWDFSKWQADVVVVNLGTNDSGKPIEGEHWKSAYRAFIAKIRSAYPKAHIFLTIGSMGHGPQDIIPKLNTELVATLATEGETKVHAVALANQDQRNGIGADWHPSIKTHQLMADQIAAEIRTVMHW